MRDFTFFIPLSFEGIFNVLSADIERLILAAYGHVCLSESKGFMLN